MTSTASGIDLPFDEAIRFFRDKANVTTDQWTDVWDAAHSKGFMVAGANRDALVADFRAAIDKGLSEGTTQAEFLKDFNRIAKQFGWSYRGEAGWRSKVIFETNLRTAYAAGQYSQLTAPETLAALPYWQYNHSGALHPRRDHLSWNGLCLPADDPFWDTAYPPNGFGCGCFVTPLSKRGLRQLGKAEPDKAPNLDSLDGQPRGIDPSFAYNPGKAWLTQTAPGPVAVAAREVEVASFVKSALDGKWPDGAWTPVAVLKGSVAKALEVGAGTEVRLSAETIRAHVKHAIATPDAYGVLPGYLVEHGELLFDKLDRPSFIGEFLGKLYQAAVKIVRRKEGQEVYLVSLRRTERRSIAKQFGIEWK